MTRAKTHLLRGPFQAGSWHRYEEHPDVQDGFSFCGLWLELDPGMPTILDPGDADCKTCLLLGDEVLRMVALARQVASG